MSSSLALAAVLSLSLATATGGRLELSDRWIGFDEVELGDSDSQALTLENTGDRAVEIYNVDYSGDDGFQVDGGDCEGLLEPGQTCDIEIQFEPEELGRASGEVEIETSVGDLDVNVDGRGVSE
jgi:hypothetical protein